MNHLKTFNNDFARSYPIRVLLGTLIALVAADGVISEYLVTHGFALEGNPFLQNWIGEENFLVIKMLGALLAALALGYIYEQNPRLSFISTLCFVMLYTVIVGWSLYIFLFTHA